MAFQPIEQVPLAPLTTLELGGCARYLAKPATDPELLAALDFAETRHIPVLILGGGSNLVIGDDGFPGLALHLDQLRPIVGEKGRFTMSASETFDSAVAHLVENGWAGLECLSGIPGTIGAAPVQNIGAYGQEIADTLFEVRVIDRFDHTIRRLSHDECRFGYRHSLFKLEPDRYIILDVTLNLHRTAPSPPRNDELARALPAKPDVRQIREAVLAIRRRKGMVYDRTHPCHRSAGSFFTNPIVTPTVANLITETALSLGKIHAYSELPRYPLPDGQVKLPAAWLIEKAGIPKGFRQGPVGISPHHALALVHYGGGTTAHLLRLARYIQDTVQKQFQVALTPEPVFIGIDEKK